MGPESEFESEESQDQEVLSPMTHGLSCIQARIILGCSYARRHCTTRDATLNKKCYIEFT